MKRVVVFALSLALALLCPGCKAEEPAPSDNTGVLRYDGIYCYIADFDSNGSTTMRCGFTKTGPSFIPA